MQMGFIERLFERLGLVADTAVRDDPDEYIPIDPLASATRLAFIANERAARIRTGVEPCPHLSESVVDLDAPDDRDALYRCNDCGLTYRHIVDDEKPWLIRGFQPVGMRR